MTCKCNESAFVSVPKHVVKALMEWYKAHPLESDLSDAVTFWQRDVEIVRKMDDQQQASRLVKGQGQPLAPWENQ